MTGHRTKSHHSLVPAYNNRNQSAQFFSFPIVIDLQQRMDAALHNHDDVVGIFIACFFSGMLQISIFSPSPDPLHLPVTNDQKETVLTVALRFFLSFFVVARLTLATRPPPLEDDFAGRDQWLDTGLLTKYLCLLVQTLNWFHIMARPQHRNEVGAP